MREIKFRGKWVISNRWIEGYGVKMDKGAVAKLYTDSGFYNVYSESVGQYIGITYNDHDIFEGELIKFKHKQTANWDVAKVVYFGEIGELSSYPAFDLNGQHIKHHHFEGNALSEIFDSGEYDIEFVGAAYENKQLIQEGSM